MSSQCWNYFQCCACYLHSTWKRRPKQAPRLPLWMDTASRETTSAWRSVFRRPQAFLHFIINKLIKNYWADTGLVPNCQSSKFYMGPACCRTCCLPLLLLWLMPNSTKLWQVSSCTQLAQGQYTESVQQAWTYNRWIVHQFLMHWFSALLQLQ